MAANSRMTIAVHVLAWLALAQRRGHAVLTSGQVAGQREHQPGDHPPLPERAAPGRAGGGAARGRGGMEPGQGPEKSPCLMCTGYRAGTAVRAAPRRAQPGVPGGKGDPAGAEPVYGGIDQALRRELAPVSVDDSARHPSGAVGEPRVGRRLVFVVTRAVTSRGTADDLSAISGRRVASVHPAVRPAGGADRTVRPGVRREPRRRKAWPSWASFAIWTTPTGSCGCGASPACRRARRLLASFYGGPVWKVNAAEANATMIDTDDVLLLRPATEESGFPAPAVHRVPAGRALGSVVARPGHALLPRPPVRSGLHRLLHAGGPPCAH